MKCNYSELCHVFLSHILQQRWRELWFVLQFRTLSPRCLMTLSEDSTWSQVCVRVCVCVLRVEIFYYTELSFLSLTICLFAVFVFLIIVNYPLLGTVIIMYSLLSIDASASATRYTFLDQWLWTRTAICERTPFCLHLFGNLGVLTNTST